MQRSFGLTSIAAVSGRTGQLCVMKMEQAGWKCIIYLKC